MIQYILDNQNSENNVDILSRNHLFGTCGIDIVDVIIRINNTIDLTNNSLQLEYSILRESGYMSVSIERTLCQAYNISMNKLQFIYMLKKWLVYNIDTVPMEESCNIEELIDNINKSSTIQDIINTATLTKCVLECLGIYRAITN